MHFAGLMNQPMTKSGLAPAGVTAFAHQLRCPATQSLASASSVLDRLTHFRHFDAQEKL